MRLFRDQFVFRAVVATVAVVVAVMGTATAFLVGRSGGAVIFLVAFVVLVAAALRGSWMRPVPEDNPDAEALSDRPRPKPFPRFSEWETQLSDGQRDRRYYDRVVRPRLYLLAGDLARDRHGSAAGDDVLRERLGPSGWALVDPAHEPSERRAAGPSPHELADLLTRMERI